MEVLSLVPQQFLCPISLELMSDPVILCTGITYDRLSIENWLSAGHKTCPVTNQVLVSKDLVPNVVLQRLIDGWCSRNNCLLNRSKSAVHSPPELFSELLQNIEDGSRPVLESLRRVRTLALENRGNIDTISSGRGLRGLSAVLSRLRNNTRRWNSDDTGIYRGALGILCMLSLNDETKFALIHSAALPLAITFLDKADIQYKVNFVRLLGDLAREEHIRVGLCAIQGLLGSLFDLLGQADANLVLVETTLVTLCELCMENCFRLSAMNLRTISKLASLLRSREGTVCEKSVEFLQLLLLSPEDCRAAANEGAFIIVPALTSAILEVSEAVTDNAVRILCKLCIDKSCRREAVRTDAVAKALLLLQAHCTTPTKTQAMKLLQLLSKDCNQVPYVYRLGTARFPIAAR